SSLDATTASLDKVAAGHGSARQGAQQHTESSQALSEAQSGLNEILGLTGINLSGLGEHFSQIGEGLSGLTGEAAESSIALDALGAGVAGLAAGAIVASTESFVELSDQVREFSEQTGLTQPTVQALMLGMNELGLSSDTAGRAFIQMDTNTQRLADSLAKGKVPTDSFTSGLQALHINLQQFVQEAPDQQLATLMDAFQRLGDSTQTTALAADVFGRRIGPELIPFLVQGSGALDELKGKIDQAGSSVADSQDKVLAWHTALADLQNSLQGLENEIGGPTITALSSLVNKVNEAVQAAKLLSDALGGWADKIGGIGTVVQFLLNPVQGLADKLTFLPGPLQEVLHQVTGILNPLTDAKDAFGLLGDALDKVTGKHQQHAQAARDDAAATQDAGTAADTAAAQVAEEEAALNLGTQSAAQLAQAHQLLSQMEQESNKSASDAAVVRQAEADAIRWVATSGDAGYAALQQLADVQKNSADPAAQQLAKDTSDFVTILRSGLIPGALDTTTAAQGLDQALQGVATSARSTQSASDIAKVTLADLDEQFQTGAIDASTYADKLAQLITKPSAAMLALQAQVSQNTATIKAWDAQVADASPIEQRIAALQKQLDQEQATGASQQQVARTQAELTANIQADTSGLGENVAAGQHNIDMLQNTVRADQARYDAMSASNRAQADQITAAHNGALSQQDIANAVANYDRTVQPATQHTQDFAAAAQNVDGRIRDANGDLPAMKTNIDLLGIAADVAAGKFNALAGAIQTGVASAANALDRALQAAGAAQGGATGAALGAGSGSYPSAAGTLSMPQIVQGLTAAGVPHGSVAQLAAVIMAESGGSTTAGSAAGAYGLGQFMPGTWSGIGMPGTAESADLPTTFQAIARLWSQQGLAPWDAYSYVAGNGPYGEQYVGPGQGSYQQFLPAALAAASGGGNGQLPVPAPDSTRPPAGTTLSAAQQAGITSGDTQQSVTDAYNKALGITPGTATNVTPDQLGQAISQLQADQAKLKDAYDQYEALLNSGDATPAALDAANAAFKEATTAVSNDRTAVQDYSKDLQSYALDGI
ncbi:MAG TPA: lytic transglycosylase domain-containing protein, partial [Dehalococcoidia bacterium]|nr:lytic transglycosylase domain-containing protein [Dehalococcoidia bacterium]